MVCGWGAPKITEPEPPRGGRTVKSLARSSQRWASPVARLSSGSNDGMCVKGVLLGTHERLDGPSSWAIILTSNR